MGVKSSSIQEERLTENLDFYSEKNPKKETILFLSDKTKPNLKHHLKKIDNTLTNSIPTSTEGKNKSTKSNSTFNSNNEKVKFKFEWKPDPKYANKNLEVLLVGSFLENWNSFEVMKKNDESGIYEYEIYLPKKEHLFKFIINNIWQCSDLYHKKPDKENNINNYIDLTNYNTNDSYKYEESKDNTFLNAYKDDMYDIYDIYNISNEGYNLKYPLIKDLNVKAPPILVNYKKPFSLDYQSDQYRLNDAFITNNNHSKDRIIISGYNTCYKKINNYPNEKICHFIINIGNYSCNKNHVRFLITERTINKCVTFIYYKPKKSNI